MSKNAWGFDAKNVDARVRPQDDFFHYASGGWMKRHPIPKTESRWGSFTMLRHATDGQLKKLVEKVERMTRVKPGSPEQLLRDFLRSGMDLARRRELGLKPLAPHFALIDAMRAPQDIVPTLAKLEAAGLGGVWGADVDQDMKDSERYVLYLFQGGLGMPERDYYLKDDAESKRVRGAYRAYLKQLAAAAFPGVNAKRRAERVFALETALAKASMKKEDRRDVDKTYHPYSLAALRRHTPRIDWAAYFAGIGARPGARVVVMQPKFLKGVEALLHTIPLDDWKTYLKIHAVNAIGNCLTPALEKETFAFYGTALTGTTHLRPLWQRIVRIVNAGLGELLGELYVKEYFGPQSKRKVEGIVDDLFAAYEARITHLDWMSAATKKKALAKLRQMNRKLGYPDRWKSYRGLRIMPGEYAGNVLRVGAFEHRRALRKLARKKVDRAEWLMSPQTVNAYFAFGLNDIVFPAAILQPPFFSPSADDAVNYGAIGSVVGHEITHGFDDQGSKFDGSGNRKTWWTPQDRARFEKRAAAVARQFDAYEVAPGLRVNGKLTLGENIADLGGLSIAYDALMLRLAKTGRENLGGFTPEQRFFLGYAATEREQERPEFRKTQVLTDPHAPSLFRVNGPLSNLPEFYAAFGVKEGDKLYRAPKDRAKVW